MKAQLIRFDHISYVDSRSAYKPEEGYKFSEIGSVNTQGRFPYMDIDEATIDMYFYDKDVPVEVVLYDEMTGQSDIELKDNVILCHGDIKSKEEICEVMTLIGAREKEGCFDISGLTNRNKIYMDISWKDNVSVLPINWKGWNCPCFLVVSVAKLWESLREKNNVSLSEINQLPVNGKLLDVGFMSVAGLNMAMEFISPHKD